MDRTPSPDPAVETPCKRLQPPSHGGEQPENSPKKRKTTREEEIRRVSEIILVISAMRRMRGCRDPTMAEKSMIIEAKSKIVSLCEDLSPKDILPFDDEIFRVLIDDLGLSRGEEQFVGHRITKISISERFLHAKRRMEEKSHANHLASYPSQSLQNGEGDGGDHHRGTPSSVRMFSSCNAVQLPVSSGGSQAPIPVVQASAAPQSMPLPHNKGIDTPSTVPARVDRAHIRPDGKPNGSSVQHTPASTSTNQHMVNNTLQPTQSQPTQSTNSVTKNNIRDHPGNSAPRKTALASSGQTVKPAISQNTPTSNPHVRHLEISKLVQRLLDTKAPNRSDWTTSSRDYMNRAVNCPFCKVTINGVEGVLVCDACEKGYHLGCLQSYNAKGIPRGEWHCPRCLTMNRGKPFPPKYGRVTRNMNAPKTPSEKKVESIGEKVNRPSAVITVGNPVESSSLPKIDRNEIKKEDNNVLIVKKDEDSNDPGNKLNSSSIPHTNSTSNNENDVDRESWSNGGGNDENVSVGERFNSKFEGVESLESGLCSVGWVGDVDKVVDDKKYFESCCVNGVDYKVQDYVLHRCGDVKVVPVKLLAMWEDNKTNSKWLLVHKCYFPNDLPDEVGRPGAPLNNEVYESTHQSNVMAGFIQGPCEVLPFRKFGEESSQNSNANNHSKPVYIRNWFYDELKRAFCPSAS